VEVYSSTPLSVKLGIGRDSRVLVTHAPRDFELDVGPRVNVRRRVGGEFDVIVAFFTRRHVLEREIDVLSQSITTPGGLWIAWPKRTSGLATTITDHDVRDVALPIGLVDNKVCSIDTTWTALRFVWRRENRRGGSKGELRTR
jgi:hypothetical protein